LKHLDRTSLDIYRAIEPLGRAITPEMAQGTVGIYADLVEPPAPELSSIARDQVYGPDPRHRLDIFGPAEPGAEPRPVVVFVHGGGFVGGDKGGPEDPFYNNVGTWAVKRGLLGVTMIYRLAPGAPWPAGAADVALAVEWLAQNVASFGGDPHHIVLMGQSAGAVHVAGYLAGHHGSAPAAPVAGAILLSGHYDLTTLEHTSFEQAYFGKDPARFGAQSSLSGLLQTRVPCLFSISELDSPPFQQQAAQLVQAHLAAKGIWPRMLYLAGHNHISPVLQLATPVDTLGWELSHFIARCTGG
jgi:triacylglycerol lipase